MEKRIIGWLRQRRVAVVYGVLWCCSLGVIAVFFSKTLTAISHRADGEIAEACVLMYVTSVVLSATCCFFGLSIRRGRRRLCVTMQLLVFTIFLVIFRIVFDVLGGESLAFAIGVSASGVVSVYEVFFIWALFVVGAGLQIAFISNEAWHPEVNVLHGGVLVIVGILLPKMLDSHSLLRAHCYEAQCGEDELGSIMLFEMAIAYAAALAVMFVFGVFSSSIRTSVRRITGESEFESVMHSDAVPYHCDRGVSFKADKELLNKCIDGCGPGTDSSPVSLQVSPDAVDDLTKSVGSDEVSVVASKTADYSSGLSSVAAPARLMGAAVSGLVAGACFLVASGLFGRR